MNEQVNANALPVAVIGGGPVGLAAAAHLLERGFEPVVIEAGSTVGAAVLKWGHVPMFSPWRYNIDAACRRLLQRHGWEVPDLDSFPTGRELVGGYMAPLAALPEMQARIRIGTQVTGVSRSRVGKVRNVGRSSLPFEVWTRSATGEEDRLLAQAVVYAAGCWGMPNPAGASGLPAVGEQAAAGRIRYGMPDVLGRERSRYAGRRVLVVGSGHSAIGTLLDLASLTDEASGTRVGWVARNPDLTRAWGGGAADQLPQRGALGERVHRLVEAGHIDLYAGFAVEGVLETSGGALRICAEDGRSIEADELIVATGLRPDLAPLREARLDLDPALECPRALATLIDPNLHSCGTVRPHGAAELEQPDVGLFIAGMASYGRAPTFLLATGYEQVRSIAAQVAGDVEAARRVELDLPQTGVCSGPVRPEVAEEACCTPATLQGACCAPKPELPATAACCGNATKRADVGVELAG